MKIAFDVDGTLISFPDDQPRRNIIEMLITLRMSGHDIIVWSGGGKEYAEVWVKRLFLAPYVQLVMEKPLHRIDEGPFADICFDDEEVKLATVNVRV